MAASNTMAHRFLFQAGTRPEWWIAVESLAQTGAPTVRPDRWGTLLMSRQKKIDIRNLHLDRTDAVAALTTGCPSLAAQCGAIQI
jgi:hypothetical protein